PAFLAWLGVTKSEATPLTLLARSGGVRATDRLEMFAAPEPESDGVQTLHFCARGLPAPARGESEPYEGLTVGQTLVLVAGEPARAQAPPPVRLTTRAAGSRQPLQVGD